jgi:hypothetical protein
MDRTSGGLVKGELAVIDLEQRNVNTTNRIFGDPNSCWANIRDAIDFEDHDHAPYVLVDEVGDGFAWCFVWGNNVQMSVRNYSQDVNWDPSPAGRPIAAPMAAAAPYSHNMRHGYIASWQNMGVVITPGVPHTTDGKYISLSKYVGHSGESLAQGATALMRCSFDGWSGMGQAGQV